MQNQEKYDRWALSYDEMPNKTRDLEATALQTVLSPIYFSKVVELGSGTGKNTAWLEAKGAQVTSVDFSDEMQQVARKKLAGKKVDFVQADITRTWSFIQGGVDLVTCSLVLEHIENIDFIFQQASACLLPSGYFYVGELHPFKQYSGSMARFETGSGVEVLECFTHHISDFMNAAVSNGLLCRTVTEWFDEGESKELPRIVAFLFQKQ